MCGGTSSICYEWTNFRNDWTYSGIRGHNTSNPSEARPANCGEATWLRNSGLIRSGIHDRHDNHALRYDTAAPLQRTELKRYTIRIDDDGRIGRYAPSKFRCASGLPPPNGIRRSWIL